MPRLARDATRATVLVRLDASGAVGAGHLMRQVALAEALGRHGAEAVFLMGGGGPFPGLARERGVRVVTLDAPSGSPSDLERLAALAVDVDARVVVLDGYAFDAAYVGAASALRPTVVFDDLGHVRLPADAIVNAALDAEALPYERREGRPRLLLGPAFVLLRSEFVGPARPAPEAGPRTRLLLSFGGSDPTEATARVLGTLRAPPFDVTVVRGPGCSASEALDAAVATARSWGHAVAVQSDVRDMAALMEACDLAIVAAGTTLWELASLGVPTVAFAVAPNQEPNATRLHDAGALLYGGRIDALTDAELETWLADVLHHPDRLARLGERAATLVDGRGADRVARAVLEVAGIGTPLPTIAPGP
ncbi:UDP-2,4-diacetamido-2,4,6-trideoxy-beta-L-altropyranose hydrolase [Rubrivirga sp. IMCC43871]|uniref:UDP-2,4-diacetamido-2,4, 6-trideoxy-beta-L-altropyranose hydrolase n=1 Tax=Rubrivirga sp. IMCC43871 TaxID=3391575 RepID=UPI00398FB6F1